MSSQGAGTLAYLGFAGQGNLGDDAIRDAIVPEVASRGVSVKYLPVRRMEVARSLAGGGLLTNTDSHLLLGGGTVLGRALWRRHLRRSFQFARRSPAFMIGAGVEDPEFAGNETYTDAKELSRWPVILERFSDVTVRGPRSQEILASIGVASEVVGDPALLFQTMPRVPEIGRPVLGVNVTAGEDQWGGHRTNPVPAVASFLQHVVSRGWLVTFYNFEAGDVAVHRELARSIVWADEQPLFVAPSSSQAFVQGAAQADFFLGTRLHAAILATAAGQAPAIIEYRPKCRDFAASVGLEDRCFRIDQLRADDLIGVFEARLQDPSVEAANLARVQHAVDGYRRTLALRLRRIADTLRDR